MNILTWYGDIKSNNYLIIYFNKEFEKYRVKEATIYFDMAQKLNILDCSTLSKEFIKDFEESLQEEDFYTENFYYVKINQISDSIIEMIKSEDPVVVEMGIKLTQ